MKLLFAFVFGAGLLIACNNEKNKVESTGVEQHEQGHEQTQTGSGLGLNNGQKWKSDSSTDKNVAALHQILQQFQIKESPTMGDFASLSAELQHGIDTMVKECRMKGPDHDALHLWLGPLMENVKELKKETNKDTAASLVLEIKERVQVYSQFFAS